MDKINRHIMHPSFNQLLSHELPLDNAIALRNGNYIHRDAFRNDIANINKQLKEKTAHKWAIYCTDSYIFLVTFIALLVSGKEVIILPKIQTGFINSICSEFDALVSDQENIQVACPTLFPNINNPSTLLNIELHIPDEPNKEISLFTSGSTGKAKKVSKKLHCLVAEVLILEKLWGNSLQNAMIFSTVNHQHIYGLLFKILWPFFTGRCFDSTNYHYPEPLLDGIQQQQKVVLISSPTHLTRMPKLVDLRIVKNNIVTIFSSAGPLPKSAAIYLQNLLPAKLIEIFGSTETGGIAYRSQTTQEENTPWLPLPGIRIQVRESNKHLLIRSPFEGTNQWHEMEDMAKPLENDQFLLLGRTDKIVKVEGKRLSLTELENRLLQSELINTPAATVLEDHRNRVAVVAVLSEAGHAFLHQQGKNKLNCKLRAHLSQFFEAVVLPKKWRYVEALPVNEQGKVTQADIQNLFTSTCQEITEPNEECIKISNNQIILSLTFPKSLIYFDGHFPEEPVLPGVVQLDWAGKLGKKHLGASNKLTRMEAIKFYDIITPNDTVILNLRYNANDKKLYFKYSSNKGRHSSGRLIME